MLSGFPEAVNKLLLYIKKRSKTLREEQMKKFSVLFSVLALVMCLAGSASAKRMMVVNTDKGEMTNDNGAGIEVTLSEDNSVTKGGLTLMLKAGEKGGGWLGEFNPKRGVWDGYESFKFDCFNPDKSPASLNFMVKPVAGATYDQRFDCPVVIRPGKSVAEVTISGANTNSGAAIDWTKKIYIWNLSGFKPNQVLYMQNFRLETEDAEEEAPKTKKK